MRDRKRWIAVAFAILFISANLLLPMSNAAVQADDGPSGSGTASDPYIVNSPSHLVWMQANYASIYTKHFKQTADIDMASVTNFTPIGNGTSAQSAMGTPFSGTYDGQAFKIEHLTIASDLSCVGLFQYLANNAEIRNIVLAGASITSTNATNYACVGGIVGYAGSSTIRNCSVGGSVSMAGAANSSYAGGIAGDSYASVYDSCCTAAVSNSNANSSVGGIASYTGNATLEIKRCYFAGSLGGAATTKGAMVGLYFQGTLQNNFYLSTSASYALGSTSSDTGAARASEADMKQPAIYTGAGWDFTTIWKINAGADYPQFITTPGKPANVAAEPGDGKATVTWDAAAKASGYHVYYGTSPGSYGSPVYASGTRSVLTGLTNNQTYYIAVKALHTDEEGPISDETTATPHKTVEDLAATPDSNRVDLAFSAAEGADSVVLLISADGGAFAPAAGISLDASSTGAAVTGLVNGTQYSFKLELNYGAATYYSNTVTAKAGDPDNTLSSLTAAGCTLSEAFSPSTLNYTSSVASGVGSIDVTASANSALAAVTINGAAQASGVAKTVPLVAGTNTIRIVVTAENGVALTYTITVTRPLPDNAVTRVADANWGDWMCDVLYTGWYDDVENAALKFDLSSYTDEMVAVTLKIYVSQENCTGTDGAFDLYGSDDDAWTTSAPSGHDASPLFAGVTGTASGWRTFDVTEYVKDHLENKDSTVTFYFAGRDSSPNYNDIAFYSLSNGEYKPCIVLVFRSNDAKLSSITVNGSGLPGFSPETYVYNYEAPHGSDLSALVFGSVTNDFNATQGAWAYNAAAKTWSVTVTAENGETQVYTVNVSEAPSTDATLTYIRIGGVGIAGFSPSTLSYTYDVPHGSDGSSLSLSSAVSDAGATQSGWSFNSATRVWTNTVTAEDGTTTRTYTVTVNELPSTDATLAYIRIGGVGIAGFSPTTLSYTYDVPHGTDGSTLTVTSAVHDSTASQGSWSWNAAQKKWSVTVTAQDGTTTRTYTVTVNELPNTDATLSYIRINGTAISGFTPSTFSYTQEVAHGTDNSTLTLTSAPTDPNATQSAWAYNAATKTWSVTVTAEDGTTSRIYWVAITQPPSTDATLAYIRIGGAGIAGFSPSTLSYTYNVPHGSDGSSLSLSSAVSDAGATQSGWSFNSATRVWTNTVTAEDGTTTRTYTVTVNELPSTDATLAYIRIGGVGIAGFSPATLNYTYDVPHGTDGSTLTVTSAVHDSTASQGSWSWNAAQKKWSVTVTAQDGTTTRTYTVTVNELPNTDATLSYIRINGTAISGFTPSTFSYTQEVAHGTDNSALALTSAPTDPNATQGAWAYNAATKTWSVTVTAEDGTTRRTYSVAITQPPGTDATLKNIKVGGAAISGYDPATQYYTYDVPHGTNASALTVTGEANDPAASVGAWTYDAGSCEWSAVVTAEDGTTRTYTVAIHILPGHDATLRYIRINGANLSGFSAAVTSYTHTVAYGTNVSAITMSAETTDPDAVMSAWVYSAASRKWSVAVVADDGTTTKTYSVTFVYATTPAPPESPEPAETPEPTGSPEAALTPALSNTATPVPSPTSSPEPTPAATAEAYTVKFVATDGQSPITGASLTVDGETRTTGADGSATFSLIAGAHSYSAAKDGFQSVTGSITANRDAKTVCVLLVPLDQRVLYAGGDEGGGDNGFGNNQPVLIAPEGALPGNDVRLVVNSITAGDTEKFAVQKQNGDSYDIVGLFDIYLLVDSAKAQPNAPVRVGVPIPEGMDGSGMQIVRINDDGTVTRFETTLEGGMLFFTTDHFSKYAIVKSAAQEPAGAGLSAWLLLAVIGAGAIALAFIAVVLIRLNKRGYFKS